MSVPIQTPIEKTTLPQGQLLTTLNFTFKYIDSSTIGVSVNGVNLADNLYTVTGQAVTFVPALIGIVGGSSIIVFLDITFSRAADLLQSSPIFANDLNKQLDRLTLMLQQIHSGSSHVMTFPAIDSPDINSILPMASLRANKTIVFNSDGSIGVSTDNYVNQVALCQEQVALASNLAELAKTQALNLVNNATQAMNSAYEYSTSAEAWANTSNAIAIPEGSIGANKLSVNDIFTFNGVSIIGNDNFYSANSGVDVQTDITSRTGGFHGTKNGMDVYTSFDNNIAFAGLCHAQNRRVYLMSQGMNDNRGGVSIRDYEQTTSSEISATSNGPWGYTYPNSPWSQIVRQSDFLARGNTIETDSNYIIYNNWGAGRVAIVGFNVTIPENDDKSIDYKLPFPMENHDFHAVKSIAVLGAVGDSAFPLAPQSIRVIPVKGAYRICYVTCIYTPKFV